MSVAAAVATKLLALGPVLRVAGRGLAILIALWGAWTFIGFLCTATAVAVNTGALALDARALTGAHIAGGIVLALVWWVAGTISLRLARIAEGYAAAFLAHGLPPAEDR